MDPGMMPGLGTSEQFRLLERSGSVRRGLREHLEDVPAPGQQNLKGFPNATIVVTVPQGSPQRSQTSTVETIWFFNGFTAKLETCLVVSTAHDQDDQGFKKVLCWGEISSHSCNESSVLKTPAATVALRTALPVCHKISAPKIQPSLRYRGTCPE